MFFIFSAQCPDLTTTCLYAQFYTCRLPACSTYIQALHLPRLTWKTSSSYFHSHLLPAKQCGWTLMSGSYELNSGCWDQTCPLEAQRKLCSEVPMWIWPLEAKHYFAYIEPDSLIKESTETQRGAVGQPLNPCVLWSSVHSHYWCWQSHRQRERK